MGTVCKQWLLDWWRFLRCMLVLPYQFCRVVWDGSHIGVCWHVGPSWESSTLVPTTGKTVVEGRSRLCRSVFARLYPRTLRWKDAPIIDTFVDHYYQIDREMAVEEYAPHYWGLISGKTEHIAKKAVA